jgi:hypothetical protein
MMPDVLVTCRSKQAGQTKIRLAKVTDQMRMLDFLTTIRVT